MVLVRRAVNVPLLSVVPLVGVRVLPVRPAVIASETGNAAKGFPSVSKTVVVMFAPLAGPTMNVPLAGAAVTVLEPAPRAWIEIGVLPLRAPSLTVSHRGGERRIRQIRVRDREWL